MSLRATSRRESRRTTNQIPSRQGIRARVIPDNLIYSNVSCLWGCFACLVSLFLVSAGLVGGLWLGEVFASLALMIHEVMLRVGLAWLDLLCDLCEDTQYMAWAMGGFLLASRRRARVGAGCVVAREA